MTVHDCNAWLHEWHSRTWINSKLTWSCSMSWGIVARLLHWACSSAHKIVLALFHTEPFLHWLSVHFLSKLTWMVTSIPALPWKNSFLDEVQSNRKHMYCINIQWQTSSERKYNWSEQKKYHEESWIPFSYFSLWSLTGRQLWLVLLHFKAKCAIPDDILLTTHVVFDESF
jgi:hypothetical protein